MPKIFYVLLLSFPLSTNAQYPWSTVSPTLANAYYDVLGNASDLYLKLDTLMMQVSDSNEMDFNVKSVLQKMYSGENKIGYGYVTKQGDPIGVWQYFVKKNNVYEKICEGSYLQIGISNLEVNRDFVETSGTLSEELIKKNWLQSDAASWLFTKEWRFYSNGKLREIVAYDHKYVIKLTEVRYGENDFRTTFPIYTHRLSGQFKGSILFLNDGSVESISGAINLDFKDSKPVVLPLE